MHFWRLAAACCATWAALWLGMSAARAGGGPENLLLVVNSHSWASQTIANHYIALRKIPAMNVVYLDWAGGIEPIDGNTFRAKILGPTLETMERRGLRWQIDYIVYSSDFPTAVNLTTEFANVKFDSKATPMISLNSATYLWYMMIARSPYVVDTGINRYFRNGPNRQVDAPTVAFHGWYGWGPKGELLEAGGQQYMLSTLLAVTSGRGTSVSQALNYLKRSVAADGTHPKGTIYFSKTDDVRTKARFEQFPQAVEELKKLGLGAQVISTATPVGRADVLGAMIGVNNFSWPKSRSTILPGAICENLTSFGGIMAEDGGQTPMTEFLRYGAAGTSGTVVEPYAMWMKFPSPLVHVHYARGCSLAEAYYQSVFGPAQLLIVGDALGQPWADIPKVSIEGVTAGATISGKLELTPTAKVTSGEIERFELYVDGRRVDVASPGSKLTWDTSADLDGTHELRVVAIGPGPIETPGRAIVSVVVNNKKKTVELTATPKDRVRWGEPLKLSARSNGGGKIVILHNSGVLGQLEGESGTITIEPRTLGAGPVRLMAIALGSEGNQAISAPVHIEIEPAKALPALTNAPAKMAPGLVLQLPNKKVVPVQTTLDQTWLESAGIRSNDPFVVQGFFDAPTEDIYQFQVWFNGQLDLRVDGVKLFEGADGNFTQKFVPVQLAKGYHRLTLSGKAGREVRLRVLFGGPGATSLTGTTFKHQAR